MKKIIAFSIISLVTFNSAIAQDSIVELKQLKQDVVIKTTDSTASIITEKQTIDFKIKKDKNDRAFQFQNPQADSNAFYELLSIDKTEINEKYNTALPSTSAALQLITVAANYSNGIKLIRQEAGGIIPGQEPKEIGGIDVNNTKPESKDGWIWILVAGITGVLLGFILSLVVRKNNKSSISQIPDQNAVDDNQDVNNELTEEKLKSQLKKAKDENKKLKAELKTVNSSLESQIAELKNHDLFLHKYFSNAFDLYIKPFNDAVEKNNLTKAFQLMFEMAFHFSSLTKHELRVKQSYDTHNIAQIMKESIQGQNNIENIDSNTPVDNIPQNIKTIMTMMHQVGVPSLGQSIVYGYKVNK